MSNETFTQALFDEVDRYIEETFIGDDPVLDAALKASDAAGLPKIAVSPSQGKLLMLFAQMARAKHILEIGTLGGYSTIWLGRGLQPGGHLISLEYEQKHAEVARANIARAGFDRASPPKRIEVRVGAALESLPKLAAEISTPFDLVFIDADKTGYPDYLQWALRLTMPGSVIIADNVVREGEIVRADSSDPNVIAVRKMNEMMAREPRLNAVILQTVGSKKHDGFAIAVVK